MNRYGLIGFPLGHSFSQRFFNAKFARESIANARYDLFPISDLEEYPALIQTIPHLKGLNVTIPHKQGIIRYLDQLDPAAAEIRAVNTIKFTESGSVGFNTDWLGFKQSLLEFLPDILPERSLILGTGGSSKAVAYALTQLGITYQFVSRQKTPDVLVYDELDSQLIGEHLLIINSTPLGMFPDIESSPAIPYCFLTSRHFLFDLVYNPGETKFMQLGKAIGAKVTNGERMLFAQAEAAWEIWNS
jgi:shikimate dehydrogenase